MWGWVLRVLLAGLRLFLHLTFSSPPYDFEKNAPTLHNSYDFIIVGAGAGGCVVAARLSETGARVLLLEEGDSAAIESAIVKLSPIQWINDRIRVIPNEPHQNARFGFNGQISNTRVGRAVGGGTSVNEGVYVRGNRHDYDHWRDLGNEGWDYESLLPYFKKSEDYRGKEFNFTDTYHGRGGPLRVIDFQCAQNLMDLLAPVAQELNLDIIDPNGPSGMGFAPMHLTHKDGLRHSASEAFLVPAMRRRNLHVLPNALVTRVLFNENKKVRGVEFVRHGQKHLVEASKEVILSAGAVFTPKLLMLSGVGPADHLKKLGISVVADVGGVGKNLDNHYNVEIASVVNDRLIAVTPLRPVSILNILKKPMEFFSEPCFTPNLHTYLNLGGDNPAWPDIDIYISPAPIFWDPDMTDEVVEDLVTPRYLQKALLLRAMLARPLSRGSITLKSTDPEDHPVIDYRVFDHPDDIKLQIKAIRAVKRILEAGAFKQFLAPQPEPMLRGCSNFTYDTDEYWECYARYMVSVDIHLCCTAKMAPDSDHMGVVSPRLKVRGVEGLRVADASVMPRVPVANTMASVYMVAEKAADMVKQEWGYLPEVSSCKKETGKRLSLKQQM